jgi:hypothetical protein
MVAVFAAALLPAALTLVRSSRADREKAEQAERRSVSGRPRLVRVVSSRDAGVHEPVSTDVPYIHRDVEDALLDQLAWERRALVVGPSMSGKTRLALEAARKRYGDLTFLVPRKGDSLHERRAEGIRSDRALIWLDDLEGYTVEGMRRPELSALLEETAETVVLATLRTTEYDRLVSTADLKPPGWDAVTWFGAPIWLDETWSAQELGRLAATGVDGQVMESAREFGLSFYLGGAPLVDTRLRTGRTTNPLGYGVVRAVSDWRRVGLERPLAENALRAVLPAYLSREHTDRPARARVADGIRWATEPINHRLALVTTTAAGFQALDRVLDRFVEQNDPVPDAMWDLALGDASSA